MKIALVHYHLINGNLYAYFIPMIPYIIQTSVGAGAEYRAYCYVAAIADSCRHSRIKPT